MTREDAVRKVAALLKLAERGGTKEEALSAATFAQKLMDKYEIEHNAFDSIEEKEEDIQDFQSKAEGELYNMGGRYSYWRVILARDIAIANGCFTYTSFRNKKRTIEIVGRPSSVGTVRYIYGWLCNEVEEIGKLEGMGMGRIWNREFKEGMSSELGKMLKEERKKTIEEIKTGHSNNPLALQRIEQSVVKLENRYVESYQHATKFHKFTYDGINRNVGNNQSAREAGQQAARSVNLSNAGNKRIGKVDRLLD